MTVVANSTRLDLRAYIELAHLVEQCRARYAENFCGLLDAAAGVCKDSADVAALGPIADFGERWERRRAWLLGVRRKQRFGADPWCLTERYRTLDTIAQLAHVAGPGMLEQRLLGGWREAMDITDKCF